MILGIDVSEHRKPDHDILPIFWRRWSPRAMSGEAIGDGDLKRLLEAARWAPSSYNEQPWRFLYARRGGKDWNLFFDALMEANQAWAKNAAVLMLVVSKKTFTKNGKPNAVHTFDCGSAWENLALQGAHMALVVHGMAGFDRGVIRQNLHVPEDYEPEAMIAIGRPGKIEDLPEKYREMEQPSGRKRIEEFAFEGRFPD